MIINRTNMDSLFQTFNTKFNEAQKHAQERAFGNDLLLDEIALALPVTGAATVHPWIEQIRGIREWIGDRLISNLKLGKLTVTNRDFENTVAVPANDIEDDQYGVFAPLIGMMGADAQTLWIKLAVDALLGNGTWADGNPFFCASRVLGDSTITNAVTTSLSQTAVEAGIAAMRGWTLNGGEPAEVAPRYLVCGPTLEATAKAICEAEIVANTEGTAGVSNVSPARALKVRVSNRIVGTHANKWFIAGVKGGLPPVVVQQRKLPVLTRKDRPEDDNVFNQNQFLYGVHARGESFLSLPFLAYAGGLGSVAAFDPSLAE